MKTIIFILLFTTFNFMSYSWAQEIEPLFWNKKDINYIKEVVSDKVFYEHSEEKSFIHLSFNLYKELISKFDGENCPFIPSCSEFFLEAYKRTNIINSILLLSDRFQREINPFKKDNYQICNNRFIDRVEEYIFYRND